ncbi:MAG: GNAT family N-acetyltransferase [Pseudomonadota bacterium]
MTTRIRAARPEDAAACVTILRDWIVSEPWMPMLHTRASMETFWTSRLSEVPAQVLVKDNQVTGFAVFDAPWLTALYLTPAARGQGNGARLLTAITTGAPVTDLWVFEANTVAHQFYAAQGFREVRRTAGDNEEGLPDIHMRRG